VAYVAVSENGGDICTALAHDDRNAADILPKDTLPNVHNSIIKIFGLYGPVQLESSAQASTLPAPYSLQ
jgi:hypothetical protein